MSQHGLLVTEWLTAQGIELCTFSVHLTVNHVSASGDGWTSPREPSHFELNHVAQNTGPHIQQDQLIEWAEAWVQDNQGKIACEVQQWAGEPF